MNTRRSLLAFALVFCLLFTACPKRDQMIGYAEDVVSGLNAALPLFQSLGMNTAKIQQAVGIAGQLVTAFRQHADEDALNLTASLIPVFESIAADANLIQNPATRTKILVALAVAQIALRFIARNITSLPQAARATGGPSGNLARIHSFGSRKAWRCRSSVSGRYEKMEVCKASPETTTVETY